MPTWPYAVALVIELAMTGNVKRSQPLRAMKHHCAKHVVFTALFTKCRRIFTACERVQWRWSRR